MDRTARTFKIILRIKLSPLVPIKASMTNIRVVMRTPFVTALLLAATACTSDKPTSVTPVGPPTPGQDAPVADAPQLPPTGWGGTPDGLSLAGKRFLMEPTENDLLILYRQHVPTDHDKAVAALFVAEIVVGVVERRPRERSFDDLQRQALLSLASRYSHLITRRDVRQPSILAAVVDKPLNCDCAIDYTNEVASEIAEGMTTIMLNQVLSIAPSHALYQSSRLLFDLWTTGETLGEIATKAKPAVDEVLIAFLKIMSFPPAVLAGAAVVGAGITLSTATAIAAVAGAIVIFMEVHKVYEQSVRWKERCRAWRSATASGCLTACDSINGKVYVDLRRRRDYCGDCRTICEDPAWCEHGRCECPWSTTACVGDPVARGLRTQVCRASPNDCPGTADGGVADSGVDSLSGNIDALRDDANRAEVPDAAPDNGQDDTVPDVASADASTPDSTDGEQMIVMTWEFTDLCNDKFHTYAKLFDKSNGWFWPADMPGFVVQDGQTTRVRILCKPNYKICYGAWPLVSRGNYWWGNGPQGDKGCTACCADCAGVTISALPLECDDSKRNDPMANNPSGTGGSGCLPGTAPKTPGQECVPNPGDDQGCPPPLVTCTCPDEHHTWCHEATLFCSP